jgi:hypothetical protein
MNVILPRMIRWHQSFHVRASVAALFLALSMGYGLASLLALADWRWIVIAGVFVAAGGISFQILRQWRFGVTIFFAWIVVEDLVRKYLGNQIVLYAAKDVLIGVTYASFLLRRRASGHPTGWKNPLVIPLLVSVGVAIVNSFNGGIDHPAIPLVGLRMNFLYLPLLVLGAAYFDSAARVRRFVRLSLSLGGIVALLGLIQSAVGLGFLNPDGFVPGLRLELIRVAPESQLRVPRPNSVFVDAGRFSQYLFVLFYLAIGALCSWPRGRSSAGSARTSVVGPETRQEADPRFPWELRRKEVASAAGRDAGRASSEGASRGMTDEFRERIVLWLCFGLIAAGLLVSAQRAVLLLVTASLVWIALVAFAERLRCWFGRTSRRTFPLARAVICMAGAITLYGVVRPDRLEAIYRFCVETLSPLARETELAWRPAVYWQDIVKAVRESGIIGHGTGTASLGLQYIYHLDYMYADQLYPYAIEGGYAAVIWEGGLLGLAVWLWWTLHLLVAAVRTTRALRGSSFYWMAVALSTFVFCYLFPYFFLGVQVYQNYVINAYHWLLCGLLFRLPAWGDRAVGRREPEPERRPLAVA